MGKELKQISVGEERGFKSNIHDNGHNTNNIIVTNKQLRYMEYNQHQQHHQPPDSKQQDVKIEYDSIVPEARRQTKLIISVKEKSGTPVREYELVHEKLMHLIIVGDDLSYFSHIHPKLENNGENFVIPHTFPEAGKYKLWVDFKPKGGNQNVLAFMLNVKGLPVHNPVLPVHDGIYMKESSDKNYQINLKLPQENIVANKDIDFVFTIYDTAGNPIIDLEPLMGAGGHSVIISNDTQEFLHVHPIQEVEPTWKGGPHISFRTIFPKSGLYKAWGQFQHRGKLIMADFILKVS